MGSTVIRSFANRQQRKTIISALRPTKHCVYFSISKGMYYLKSQQRCLQDMQHSNTSYLLLHNYVHKVDNVREFSMTCVLTKSKDRGKDKKKQNLVHIDYNEIGQVLDVDKLTTQFEKTIDILKNDFIKYLSVRSSIGAIEELTVKFEGKDYVLQELAQISRKPKLIVLNISTFPQAIPDILKSLKNNQMNLNPQQDGTTLYIPIPKVTKEYRESLSKNAKSFYVKCCNNIRDVRNKEIKVLKSKPKLAKDLVFRIETYIDTLSHQYMGKAEEILETKTKELLGDSE